MYLFAIWLTENWFQTYPHLYNKYNNNIDERLDYIFIIQVKK